MAFSSGGASAYERCDKRTERRRGEFLGNGGKFSLYERERGERERERREEREQPERNKKGKDDFAAALVAAVAGVGGEEG